MPLNELERVAADVSSIRNAMRLEKPYTFDDVKLDVVTALTGLAAVLLIAFSPLEAKPAFGLALLPGAAYFFHYTAKQRRRRATNPSPWKEEKLAFQAGVIALPLIVGWMFWGKLAGDGVARYAGASAIYFVGVALGVFGIIDSNRRRYLAGAVVLLAFGLALPSLTPSQTILGGSWAMLAGGLLSAGITLWQLRTDGESSAPGNAAS